MRSPIRPLGRALLLLALLVLALGALFPTSPTRTLAQEAPTSTLAVTDTPLYPDATVEGTSGDGSKDWVSKLTVATTSSTTGRTSSSMASTVEAH